MKKKIFALMLAAVLVVLLLPISAFAATPAVTRTTALNLIDASPTDMLDSEGWKWETDGGNKLTLKNFNLEKDSTGLINCNGNWALLALPADTTIVLEGENFVTITGTDNGGPIFGIYAYGNVTIEGIVNNLSLTVTSCDKSNDSGSTAFYLSGNLTVGEGNKLVAKGGKRSEIFGASYGIRCGGLLKVDGSVDASSGTARHSYGIYAGNLTVSGSGTVKTSAAGAETDSTGVLCTNMTIEGSLRSTGENAAIRCLNTPTIHEPFYSESSGSLTGEMAVGVSQSTDTDFNFKTAGGETAKRVFIAAPTATFKAVPQLNGNGAPLVLEEGTTPGNTVIYIDTNKNGAVDADEPIFDPDGTEAEYNGTVEGNDLSRSYVHSGTSGNNDFSDTLLTMNGGTVYGLTEGLGGTINGNVTININGGTVFNVDVYSKTTGDKILNVGGSATIGTEIGGGINISENSDRNFENFNITGRLSQDVYIILNESIAKTHAIAAGATEADMAHLIIKGTGSKNKKLMLLDGNVYVVDADNPPEPAGYTPGVVHEINPAAVGEENPNTGAAVPLNAAAVLIVSAAVLKIKK